MYYDNGKVTAFINEIKAENKPDNYSYKCGSHDMYSDYFDTLEEAKEKKLKRFTMIVIIADV